MSQTASKSYSPVATGAHAPPLSVFQGRRAGDGSPEYDVEVWCSAGQIDVAAWDRLSSSHELFMDVRLLQSVEQSMARDASFRYVLFRDQRGEPAASACLCTYSVDGTVLVD